ncbi:TMEM43 family protein [Thiotrichales bacterium HSG1]|nr:TMEM43 family protein [Thiotrichales bacterium HSG1]
MAKITTNFFQRLQQSRMVALLLTIMGLFFGLWFCISTITNLALYEQDATRHAKTLTDGKNNVTSVDVDQIDVNNDNKLIHIVGETTVDEIIVDKLFKIEVVNVIKLHRIVQMYQWQEDDDSNYKKVWSKQFINSKKFANPNQHKNPNLPFTSKVMTAKQVILGDFIVPNLLVKKMDHYQELPMQGLWQEQENLRKLFPNKKIHFTAGSYYIGRDFKQPKIGDLKLSFMAVLPENISIIAKQGSQLGPYITANGGSIELFEYGIFTKERMFRNARTSLFTTGIQPRLESILLIFIGIYIIFHILWVASPSLLNPNDFRGWLLALIISVSLTLSVISFSWHEYNSTIGKVLFTLAVIILYLLKFTYKPQKLVSETIVPQKSEN